MTSEETRTYKRLYARRWRENNRERSRENARRAAASQRESLRQARSDRGCIRCGSTDARILDFHHRDPDLKSFNFGRRPVGLKAALKEAEKCDVMCSNCHRITEWEKGHDA